jgi:hypothetical protein
VEEENESVSLDAIDGRVDTVEREFSAATTNTASDRIHTQSMRHTCRRVQRTQRRSCSTRRIDIWSTEAVVRLELIPGDDRTASAPTASSTRQRVTTGSRTGPGDTLEFASVRQSVSSIGEDKENSANDSNGTKFPRSSRHSCRTVGHWTEPTRRYSM